MELQRLHLAPGDELHHGAQGGFHHAAGGAEDDRRAGGHAQHLVKLSLRQVVEEDARPLDHPGQLAGGQGHVHRHAAIGHALLFPLDLVLLGGAGHDGHHKDVLGVDAGLLGVIALHQGAEHLLRGLAGGHVVQHLGVVLLTVANPAGGAGGDEGQLAALLDAVEELGALLHDGEVGGVVHVKDLVEAQAAQGGDHLALHVGADGHAEALAQRDADGGGGAHHHVLGGVVEGLPHLGGVVLLLEGARGAGHDALAAGDAVHLGQVPVEGAADVGGEAAVVGADDPHLLVLPAHGGAAAAQDALGVVPDQVGSGVLDLRRELVVGVAHGVDAQLGGQLTQLAVSVPGAGQAVHPVVGQNQLQGELAGMAHLLGVGVDLHALADRVHAGGHQAFGPLHLHHADAAGADLVDVLQETQRRDIEARGAGRLQHRGALGNGDGDVVDAQRYHLFVHVRSLPYCL